MARKKKKAKVISMGPPMSLSKYIKKFGRTLNIHEVIWMSHMFEAGKGNIFVAREKRNGDILLGSFLVDTYCLGVKDTIFKLMPRYAYDEFREDVLATEEVKVEVGDPNYVFNVIYGALEYAEDLGIEPHKDFAVTEYLLDAPEDLEYVDLQFGMDGKPCFYYYDGDPRGEIIKKLEEAVGPDGYTAIDGQPMVDMLDDEYGDGSFLGNPFVGIAEANFSKEVDREAYLMLTEIMIFLDETYEENLSFLESLYRSNPREIAESISDIVLNKDLKDEGEKSYDALIAAVEKYLIYGSPGFLLDHLYLDAFNSEIDSVLHSIAMLNLTLSGDEKLKALVEILIAWHKDIEGEMLAPQDVRGLMDKHQNGDDDFEYPMIMVLNYLIHHDTSCFGPIDFDSVEVQGPL